MILDQVMTKTTKKTPGEPESRATLQGTGRSDSLPGPEVIPPSGVCANGAGHRMQCGHGKCAE